MCSFTRPRRPTPLALTLYPGLQHAIVNNAREAIAVEEDEENYDFLMDAATGEFITYDEFVALGAIGLMQAKWNRVAIKKLLDLLEKNDIVARGDRVELNDNIKKTLIRMRGSTQERYPAFAKAFEADEERKKQQHQPFTFMPKIWKYVRTESEELDRRNEDNKAGKRD